MKRVVIAELLDTDAGTPVEVSSSLRDIDRINRWFGGINASQSMILQVAHATGMSHMSLLEVASGSGKTAYAVRERLGENGVTVDLTLLDRAASHLANGNGHQSPRPSSKFVVGDALTLPFHDDSFDVVSSNLFVHHLSPEEFTQFVNEALRVSRHAVLINDVSRNWLHLSLVYAGLPLFRSRITWHDAPASVRQAYTLDEMRRMLNRSAAAHVEIRSHYLFRIGAIIWKALPVGSSNHV